MKINFAANVHRLSLIWQENCRFVTHFENPDITKNSQFKKMKCMH